MHDTLLDHVRRYADSHADRDGIAVTPVTGLVALRETAPTMLQYAVSKPLVALVLQGTKRVSMGNRTFDFGAGESLVITTDVPTVSQITTASRALPYYALILELDAAIIAELVDRTGLAAAQAHPALRVDPTAWDVADAACRLLRLAERPDALPVLAPQLIREMHYWLLCGRHGGSVRALGVRDSHAQRIGRAITLLQSHFAEPIKVEALAKAASMSLSAFHVHFRAITALSPLQFQKQLRLIEARRRMLAEGRPVTDVAYGVGYESIPQFTREYRRMFGQPPARDMRAVRAQLEPAS